MREGWKEVKLGDYYEVRSGLSKPASEFGSGFPFLSFKNVFNNYFLPHELEELVNTSEAERENMSIKKGDVFLTRTSETNDELGMSSVALKDYPNATFNGFCKRLRPKENNNFEPKYIGFYLRSPKFRAEIGQFANLTTRASLNNEIINRLNLIVPPLETQKKIASILSGYDDLIENNLKRIKILEEMAQQTYEEWFVRMRFPGHESATINSETGLPEGWEKVKLSSIYELKYGKNLPQTQILQVGAFNVYGASGKMGFYDKNNVNDKKVLVTSRGNGSGVVHRTHEKKSFVTNNSFIVNSKFKLGYTYYNLKHFDLSRFNSGSAQPQLTNSALDYVEIILPKVDIIFAFAENTCKSFELIDNLLIQNQRLREARDILLPRLMMGMVEV